MRGLVLLSAVLLGATPVMAQQAVQPVMRPVMRPATRPVIRSVIRPAGQQVAGQQVAGQQAPGQQVGADAAAQVENLQQRLLASQQTIATLERELEEAKNHAIALDHCRTKNGRLVSIGRQLIQGYEARYRQDRHHDPLQLARRRFEFELQALNEQIYDNHVDVTIHLPDPNTPKVDAPVEAAVGSDPEKIR